MTKPRSDSRILQLSEDEQSQIYEWLLSFGYVETQRRVALPRPEGFSLQTHLTSLRRFYVHFSRDLKDHDAAVCSESTLSEQGRARLSLATEEAMQYAAYQMTSGPMDSKSFSDVGRWLNRQKSLELEGQYLRVAEAKAELARKRLELERERLELNAARLALQHYTGLKDIHESPTGDQEDKIRAARDLIFGHPEAIDPIQNTSV